MHPRIESESALASIRVGSSPHWCPLLYGLPLAAKRPARRRLRFWCQPDTRAMPSSHHASRCLREPSRSPRASLTSVRSVYLTLSGMSRLLIEVSTRFSRSWLSGKAAPSGTAALPRAAPERPAPPHPPELRPPPPPAPPHLRRVPVARACL